MLIVSPPCSRGTQRLRRLPEQRPHHGPADVVAQLRKELECTALVLDEGIALAVGFQADAPPQVLDVGQIVDPEPADGVQ